jgi:Fe2+ or Zn2+ uptake regulation protein
MALDQFLKKYAATPSISFLRGEAIRDLIARTKHACNICDGCTTVQEAKDCPLHRKVNRIMEILDS